MPTGGLPEPVAPPAAGGAAMMPMGMPLGGMMPGAAGGRAGQDRPVRPKKLVLPPKPHTESVTGKAHTDRIAVSMTAADPPLNPAPPGDQPPQPPGPIIRRITMPTPRNDQS
jgi:hypothetical protein